MMLQPALPSHPLQKADLRSLLLAIAPLPPSPPLATLAKQSDLTQAALNNAIQWAQAAHLIDHQGLTPEGKLVSIKDPYLETTVTDWLIHFHISSRIRNVWQYFVHEFLPQHSTFTQNELLKYSGDIFIKQSVNELQKNFRLILKTYTESTAIAKIKFLTLTKKLYSIGSPDLSNPYTTGYLLARTWERDFKFQSAVLVDQILDADMGLISILGISREQLRQQLNILATHDVIEQRSAKPHLAGTKSQIEIDTTTSYQVVRRWEVATELLEKAYENDIATPNRPLIQSLEAILDEDDNIPDFSQFLEWASELIALDGGSKIITRLAS